MNIDLIIEILLMYKAGGKSPNDILLAIRHKPAFVTVTNSEFHDTWHHIKGLNAIKRNPAFPNDLSMYILNEDSPLLDTLLKHKEENKNNPTAIPSVTVNVKGDIISSPIAGIQSFERTLINSDVQKPKTNAATNPTKRLSIGKVILIILGALASIAAIWEFILKRAFNLP